MTIKEITWPPPTLLFQSTAGNLERVFLQKDGVLGWKIGKQTFILDVHRKKKKKTRKSLSPHPKIGSLIKLSRVNFSILASEFEYNNMPFYYMRRNSEKRRCI